MYNFVSRMGFLNNRSVHNVQNMQPNLRLVAHVIHDCFLAKIACAEHAMKIGTDGVQLLGGHGFCREHSVEIWYRNLRAIAILDGVASV